MKTILLLCALTFAGHAFGDEASQIEFTTLTKDHEAMAGEWVAKE